MRRAAALALGVALLASGCGGKAARSAAEIAPADVRSFMSVPPEQEQPLTRRALAFTPGGQRVQALLERAAWSRAAGERVEVAELRDGRLVAYALLKNTKGLDAAQLAHVRVRGWIAFAPTKAALTAARSKRHLSDAHWYTAAADAAGGSGTTFVAPGWVAIATEGGTVRRTTPGRGRDGPHPLARDIPPDAVAAAASHSGARLLRSLPVERMIGLRPDILAQATPGSAVLYVRGGAPLPNVTLLALDGSVAAARRVTAELAPGMQLALRETVNGLALWHVALGAVDLYYGRVGHTLVLTDDADVSLGGSQLEPPDLPAATSAWFYVDVPRARSALGMLARFGGASSVARSFDRKYAGLDSALFYTTHDQGRETHTIVLH
ncbi:MAG: hypothetical protein ACJ76I_08600 [Gaiellaceae bacterium]